MTWLPLLVRQDAARPIGSCHCRQEGVYVPTWMRDVCWRHVSLIVGPPTPMLASAPCAWGLVGVYSRSKVDVVIIPGPRFGSGCRFPGMLQGTFDLNQRIALAFGPGWQNFRRKSESAELLLGCPGVCQGYKHGRLCSHILHTRSMPYNVSKHDQRDAGNSGRTSNRYINVQTYRDMQCNVHSLESARCKAHSGA